jgi:hypothetical protein
MPKFLETKTPIYQAGDRVILPTGETGRLTSKPNPNGWLVCKDEDKKRVYCSETDLRGSF